MVNVCCVLGCNAKGLRGGPRFHRFPKDAVNLNRWIEILQVFDPQFKYKSANCVVCSKHFLQTDYTLNIVGAEKLKKSSVPSIFPASGTVDIDLNTDNVNEQRLIISTISDDSSATSLMASDNELEVVASDVNVMVNQDLPLTSVKTPGFRKTKCVIGQPRSTSERITATEQGQKQIDIMRKEFLLNNPNANLEFFQLTTIELHNESLYLMSRNKYRAKKKQFLKHKKLYYKNISKYLNNKRLILKKKKDIFRGLTEF